MPIGGCCCGGSPCCRTRLFRGSGLGVQSINVEFEIWGDAVSATADPGYFCPTGACPTLLHTWSTTLTYESVPTEADAPLTSSPETYHPVGFAIHRPSGWYAGASMEIGDFGYPVFNGNPDAQTGKFVFFRRADFGQQTPAEGVTPSIGACVFGWWFDDDYEYPDGVIDPFGHDTWHRYILRYDNVCFNTSPRRPAFTAWAGLPIEVTTPRARGMFFGDIAPTTCTPLLMQISGVVPRGGVSSSVLWPGVELAATSCGESISPNGGFYLRGTITE